MHGPIEARAHAIEDSGMTLLAVAQGDNSQASSIKWQRFHRENMGKMVILRGRSVFSSGKLGFLFGKIVILLGMSMFQQLI